MKALSSNGRFDDWNHSFTFLNDNVSTGRVAYAFLLFLPRVEGFDSG